jgi:methylated-DNA-[protein]-cysteine S-methyltransferase
MTSAARPRSVALRRALPGVAAGKLVPARHVRYLTEGWGVGELWLEGETVLWHELPALRAQPMLQARLRKGGDEPPGITLAHSGARDCDDSVPEVARRMAAYFAGARVTFDDVEIDLEWCTPFQRAVADALRAVPYGETVTYGELAALSGHPNAQRAAGTFCAHNRLPLILPCHRVISVGGIGSYGSLGVEYKRRLLELEGVADAL